MQNWLSTFQIRSALQIWHAATKADCHMKSVMLFLLCAGIAARQVRILIEDVRKEVDRRHAGINVNPFAYASNSSYLSQL